MSETTLTLQPARTSRGASGSLLRTLFSASIYVAFGLSLVFSLALVLGLIR